MATTYTVTGNLRDALGLPADAVLDRVIIQSNLEPGDALVDTTTNTVRLFPRNVPVNGGVLSLDLPGTNEPDLNVAPGTLRYQLVVSYQVAGSGNMFSWRGGWWPLTKNSTLAELVGDSEASPMVVEWRDGFTAEMAGKVGEAEAARLGAQQERAAAEVAKTAAEAAAASATEVALGDAATVLAAALVNDGPVRDNLTDTIALQAPTVVTPEAHGAKGNGATDDTAAVQAALQAAYAAGGGTVHLTAGRVYRCDGQLTIPHNGAGPVPAGRSIRITGAGTDGVLYPANAGPLLDLRYAGAGAKILALGRGTLELDHFTLTDKGVSSTAFLLTTNTILNAHDMSVLGNPSKNGNTCDQDAFIFGGTVGVANNTVTGGFQGYGSVVRSVQFNRIRRIAYLRVWANSVQILHNLIASGCGTNLPGGAAIECDGTATSGEGFAYANLFQGNLFQMQFYPYGIKLTAKAIANMSVGNSFWDCTPQVLACHRTEAGTDVQVFGAYWDGGAPVLSDVGGGSFALTRVGHTAGAGGHQFTSNIVANGGLQVATGQKLLVQDNGTGAANLQIARFGAGSGIGTISIENRGTPTTRRALIAYSGDYSQLLALDPGKGLGTSGGMVIQSGRGATTARPAMNGFADQGSMWFDATLGKPIWWKGTVWVDASGATV